MPVGLLSPLARLLKTFPPSRRSALLSRLLHYGGITVEHLLTVVDRYFPHSGHALVSERRTKRRPRAAPSSLPPNARRPPSARPSPNKTPTALPCTAFKLCSANSPRLSKT